ncbi:MAG TPA: MgtC/SapB family protein [Acidobacteriaceae bacterium]|nr:MgtC/SapB family protein [Acidobacteriaceae bacterium]
MPPEIHWPAIALRLVLTVLAGAALGTDRSRNGHPAGLRTTLLVTLAASVAMIQMNLLISTNGKPPNSYAVMDLMRLPLGILTGVGFIGAGAIVRKGDMVLGVTTAATLWFSTVVGLCLGGGQLVLGCVATVIGYLTLTSLRWFERRLEKFQPATLVLVTSGSSLTAEDLRAQLQAARFRVRSISIDHSPEDRRLRLRCEVRWPADSSSAALPNILRNLERTPGLVRLSWHTVSTSSH